MEIASRHDMIKSGNEFNYWNKRFVVVSHDIHHACGPLMWEVNWQICHRDLKLENTLLGGSAAPRVKICDFGYSKSSVFHSQPKSTVGTPACVAPEILTRKEYDGKLADVWSCGVTLDIMMVGAYPFQDASDPKNFTKTIAELMEGGNYECVDVNNPSQSMEEVLAMIQEARIPLQIPKGGTYAYGGSMEFDELEDADIEDMIETSGDFVGQL
ncbi:hypothetical protein K7X08_002178 [Anisodus acutangulus]|uniref:non-specific serine/threonine protein kinase n=1 Tax=Anisodus acutangulus TaxID=402998 RepID=A0A9Q1LSG7_9SOLA|nr:hypothetical protein K7X08_002178 [Anisodus acutangulus]